MDHYTHDLAPRSPYQTLPQTSSSSKPESEFRLLVGGKFTKYLTIDTGLYSVDDMCFAPSLTSMIPPPPPDHLEFEEGEKLRSNAYKVTSPHFDSTVVAKFARFPREIAQLDSETRAYEWISGHQIGPKFLGHLTEEGRVIGFLMEYISDGRHATPADLSACQHALAALHRLGIRHGDVNKHNVLIRDDQATLIDFDSAEQCDDAKLLEDELDTFEQALWDESGMGGVVIESEAPQCD